MCKPKIQSTTPLAHFTMPMQCTRTCALDIPLVALIRRRAQILGLVPVAHPPPCLLPRCVTSHIIRLGAKDQHDIVSDQAEENLVARPVQRSVRCAIDLGDTSVRSPSPRERSSSLAFCDMMLPVWTHMLYSAAPTVRVRTDPALRLVNATTWWSVCCTERPMTTCLPRIAWT